MSFLIALLISGNYWQGTVYCKDSTHCSISYSIAIPKNSPKVAPDCTNFSIVSQTPVSSSALGHTITMSCAVQASPKPIKLSASVN